MGCKYRGDGHLEPIERNRLTIGTVLRYPYQDGGVPSFSDVVVVGIELRHNRDPNVRRDNFKNLAEAEREYSADFSVYIKLVRPYLYVHGDGWLSGFEAYEISGSKILEKYKAVVNSNGEYANYNLNRE